MSVTIKQAVKAKSLSAKKSSGAKTGASPDVLKQIVQEVESLSREEVLAMADELAYKRGKDKFRLAGVLTRIHEKAKAGDTAWLHGYANFTELCDELFDLTYQAAWDLMVMYEHLAQKEIPGSIVDEIGWTKVYHLALAGKPETAKDAARWIEKVKKEKLTVNQLKSLLKGGATASIKKSWLNFPTHEDQKVGIELALDKAMEETGATSRTAALHAMSQAYLGNAITMEFKCPACGKSATSSAK